jgi:hypothetical protein
MSSRLEFEPEDRRGGGVAARRWGMILVVVAMVMVGSAAGLWAAYRVIGHHGAGGAVPLLRSDERPVKVAPANPGGMEVPDQDVYILNHDRPLDSRVEQLLPPPETPLPRPSPAEPAVTEAAPPIAAPAVATPGSAPPVAAPASAPMPVASAPAPAVAPAPAAPAAALPPPAPGAGPLRHAAYRLQVGAVRSPEAAQHEWDRLKRTDADVLGKLSAESRRVDDGARGIFYRIIAGSFPDAAAAEHACNELKRRKVGCILVKP